MDKFRRTEGEQKCGKEESISRDGWLQVVRARYKRTRQNSKRRKKLKEKGEKEIEESQSEEV